MEHNSKMPGKLRILIAKNIKSRSLPLRSLYSTHFETLGVYNMKNMGIFMKKILAENYIVAFNFILIHIKTYNRNEMKFQDIFMSQNFIMLPRLYIVLLKGADKVYWIQVKSQWKASRICPSIKYQIGVKKKCRILFKNLNLQMI